MQDRGFQFEGVGWQSHSQIGSGGIAFFETVLPRGDGAATFPDHLVNIMHDDVVSHSNWHGAALPHSLTPAGTVTFLPGGSRIEGFADGECRQTNLVLSAGQIEEVAQQLNFNPADLRFDIVSDPVAAHLSHIMALVVKSEDYKGWPLLVESISHSLSVALIAQMSPDSAALASRDYGGLDDARKQRVSDYIEVNMHRQITLDELAGVAAMSKFHFVRCFKRSFGRSPLQFLSNHRLKEAKKMLRDTSLSIAEIALACGYSSQSHMTTAFKKMVGVPPCQYRRGIVGNG